MAAVEAERDILELGAEIQTLLGEPARLDEPTSLAEVFGGVEGDRPKPTGIGDRAGHSLGFPQTTEHLLELA